VAERELRLIAPAARGVEWDYSNFGFQVLSLALERAAARPFSALLDQHVLNPLAMTCSGVTGRGCGSHVQGHSQASPVSTWTHHLWGAGGTEASAEDMARYLSACLMPPDSAVGRAIRLAQQSRHQIDTLRSAGLSARPATWGTTVARPVSGPCSGCGRSPAGPRRCSSATAPSAACRWPSASR
jgi:CubicO group peptidase (beta-lactamase class C family)